MPLTPDQMRYRREAEKQRRRKREAYRKKKGAPVRAYHRTAPVIGQRRGRTHGLRTTYNAGCTCKWCRMADAAYRGARYHGRAA